VRRELSREKMSFRNLVGIRFHWTSAFRNYLEEDVNRIDLVLKNMYNEQFTRDEFKAYLLLLNAEQCPQSQQESKTKNGVMYRFAAEQASELHAEIMEYLQIKYHTSTILPDRYCDYYMIGNTVENNPLIANIDIAVTAVSTALGIERNALQLFRFEVDSADADDE